MIVEIHEKLLRWARWEKQPDQGVLMMGYGTSVLAKVMDGRGEILPGAPRGSGPKKTYTDPVAVLVSSALKKLDKKDRKIVVGFYLSDGSARLKAERMGMPERTLYSRLNRIHRMMAGWL